MYKMNMAPIVSMLQEQIFLLEVEQEGKLVWTNQNLTDSVSLCFAPLSLSLSVVPPLMGSLFFSSCMLSLFLSPPLYLGVLLCIGLVLLVAQKSLLMTLHGNVEEYASVYEREWELFSLLLAFLFPSLFFSVCFFSLLNLPMRFLVGSTWFLFLGISLLLSRPCVWVREQNWVLLLFVDTAGVDLAPQWSLCLFHLHSC